MKKVSVLIPIFNKLEYTKKGLMWLYDAIHAYPLSNINVEVIVTDDGSTDGSKEWIEKNYPLVHIQTGNGDLWWSGGINKGVKYALYSLKSDYVITWNNDIKPGTDYFKNLEKILETTGENIITGSVIYLLNTNTILSTGGFFNDKNGKYGLRSWGVEDKGQFLNTMETDWLSGMGAVIHKSVFDKIGYFDEKNFPQYHGDSDFCLRAKKAGFKIQTHPKLKIWNDRENTGIVIANSIKELMQSLCTLKSNNNIKKDILFYKRHATSICAYQVLFKKYFKHIFGFIKWKILGIFNVKRNRIN